MKKTILLSSILAVGAVFAETTVTSGNAIGALDLTIPTDRAQTLVSVPFAGYDGGDIAVKDMVKTSTLGEGSKLYAPRVDGAYNTWTLQDGKWEADTVVSIVNGGSPTVGTAENQGTATIKRGDAFWLQPAAGTESGTIYLLGQAPDGVGTSTASAGWNLVGNTSVSSVDLDELEGETGDQIVLQVGKALRYYTFRENKGWRYVSGGKWVSGDKVTIAAGQGLWYNPKTAKTIDWSTGKVKVADANN